LSLQPGGVNSFQINDGGRTTEVIARVEGREQVKVPAGTFQTVRVRAEPVTGALKGKGTIWAWYTDDANHIPVQMRSKLGFGTLLFRLQQVEK
jgi:N6-adenosine-specific RNA methylase IME4